MAPTDERPSPHVSRKNWPSASPRPKPPSRSSTPSPPFRSSRATGRKPPADSTTPSSARSRNGCTTFAISTSGAPRSARASRTRVSSRPSWPRRSPPRIPRRGSKICTCPTSPSGGRRRRSRGRPASNRSRRRCCAIRCSCRKRRRFRMSTRRKASPTCPPRSRARAGFSSTRSPRMRSWSAAFANCSGTAASGRPPSSTASRKKARSSPTTSTRASR